MARGDEVTTVPLQFHEPVRICAALVEQVYLKLTKLNQY